VPSNPAVRSELYRYLGALPAAIAPRAAAALIDLVLLLAVAAVDFLALGMMVLGEAGDEAAVNPFRPSLLVHLEPSKIALVAAPIVFFWLWNRVVRVSRGGSSVGMVWSGIRLVAVRTGTSPSADMALVRELLGILLVLPLGLGMLPLFRDREKRAPHDKAAGVAMIQPPED
jgi:uncharacterized RDD family membrane protein YckC